MILALTSRRRMDDPIDPFSFAPPPFFAALPFCAGAVPLGICMRAGLEVTLVFVLAKGSMSSAPAKPRPLLRMVLMP